MEKKYTLAKNDGPNTLHGGLKGFDKVIWTVKSFNDSGLLLSIQVKMGKKAIR
jgi:aldose 1-epimerase